MDKWAKNLGWLGPPSKSASSTPPPRQLLLRQEEEKMALEKAQADRRRYPHYKYTNK
jgi:hypothetical protein